MGVLAPGSAHAWLSTRSPIDTSGHFLAHMFEGEGNSEKITELELGLSLGKLLEYIRSKVIYWDR